MAGLYIHIPFCKQACHYCDFYFSTRQENRLEIIQAIASEITLQKDYLEGETIETIYMGGGTPSILTAGELDKIVETVYKTFTVRPSAEFTLEANPDDLIPDKLRYFRNAGINRLSVGVQSFNDFTLKALNRAHNAEMAKHCIQSARETGLENISIDLIYAIPDRPDDVWREDIFEALKLEPQHISSYSLTIEEKTVFGNWVRQGKIKPVDDDSSASQLNLLVDVLESHSYDQYEVSNFSKPGFQSQHNSSYWKNRKYLGVGPSAHSYNGDSRQFNVSNNHLYLDSIQKMNIPSTLEVLSREDKINEFLLTSLRTSWGADLKVLREKFSYDLLSSNSEYIKNLRERNLLILDDNTVRLTRSGRLLADKIASDLFLVTS